MARSNKFLNQVKGYSAGNDFTQKQSNATTELVKRLDENEKISSQELNILWAHLWNLQNLPPEAHC